jgi:hypothetical protein
MRLILVILILLVLDGGGQEMLEFRWKWAGHVSPKVIRAETMDEILAKVKESWHRDLGVPTASATVLNYVRRLVEEHNNLEPTGAAARAGLR